MYDIEEEIDLINLGGACAAPLPTKTNPEGSDILADFSIPSVNQLQSTQGMAKKQQQGTSVDLLSDLDLSAGTAQSVDRNVGINTDFAITSTSQSSIVPSTSPKLAYSHPSRQAGDFYKNIEKIVVVTQGFGDL